MKQPVFADLIFDEHDRPVGTTYVGEEPCYVVDDQGFRRHIPSRDVDMHVLRQMTEMMAGNEEMLVAMAAKQLGTEDIFSKAMLENQIRNIDQQLENLLETGLPAEVRAYLGMMGFKIRINVHGDVVEFIQPGTPAPDDEGD